MTKITGQSLVPPDVGWKMYFPACTEWPALLTNQMHASQCQLQVYIIQKDYPISFSIK